MLANRFWQWAKSRLIDRTTPVEITPNAYTTSASARPQVLSNGWHVVAVARNTGTVDFYVSKKGDWSDKQRLCYIGTGMNGLFNYSFTSYGTTLYILFKASTTQVYFKSINALTVTDIDVVSGSIAIDTQTSYSDGSFSIAVNPTNGHLTAAWSSKNATYPNSFNIRSAKSIDGGVTWTKQDGTTGVDQLTTSNTSGTDSITPNIVYKADGYPIILTTYTISGTSSSIIRLRYTGSAWTTISGSAIYSGNPYAQSSPSATVQKYGANVGRIWVAWHGYDAIDSSYRNIFVSYSDDNGVTWATTVKLSTSGISANQLNSSITSNNKGEVFVYWMGTTTSGSSNYYIRSIKWNGSWGSIVNIMTGNVAAIQYPSTCDNYYDFEQPIAIWQDNQDYGDKILLHMNGANGSTTFTDESGKAWTANGNAKIVTTESKFGGACAYFDGTGDYITSSDNTNFTLGSGNFTIDFWVKRDTSALNDAFRIFGQSDSSLTGSTAPIGAGFNASNGLMFITNGLTSLDSSPTITDSNWHHVAIVRNGVTITYYLDGSSIGTRDVTGVTLYDSAYSFSIGRHGEYASQYFKGYIDEFRFSKNIVRWTTNFTPPTAEGVYYNNPPSVDLYGKWNEA